MEALSKLIDSISFVISTLGQLLTVAIVLGCALVISLFTPLYAQAVLALLNQVTLPPTATLTNPPTAIVVLGGGLTNNRLNDIVINQFTKERLRQAENIYQTYQLPIVVSGKEAPWMRRWLQSHNIWEVIVEKNSFNTCENARFTAQTVAVKNVILVTDPYHMNRARRQFALNGMATFSSVAPLESPLDWHNLGGNLKHSRRATYELLAVARDILSPQHNCEH
ncbi:MULTISPECIES: YdcF family protein [unclassified Moraxella]|uniref:YdcF family protein n=1 Tax=unclassified Moraxella TaxID=2685852 RepID=UPI003AF7FAA5